MAKPMVGAGGGWAAIRYVLDKGRQSGGIWRLYQRMRAGNACKTCALGMGGRRGGMVNEAGHFPEVCKKSVQAQVADMEAGISEEFLLRTPLHVLEQMTSSELESLGRIAFPLIADEDATHFRRLSWDELFERAGTAFRAASPDQTFFYASGRSSNEAGFLMQLVARAYGTNNVNNCSFYCHAASSVALGKIYGSGTSSLALEDLDQADFALLAGCNPASNHPRLLTTLMNLRRRGGKVLVVNPLKELGLQRFRVPSDPFSLLFGSRISDLYLQPHVGADIALFKALLKGVMEAGGEDSAFIARHTTGWDAVRADIDVASWDDLEEASGVPRTSIGEAVRMILDAKRGVFMWAMGLTHHAWGVEAILSLGNLALARGWLGRRGCGLLPIRGHSNVQGLGTVGVTPELKAGFERKLQEVYGVSQPSRPGLDTYAAMEAAHAGKIRTALMLGGNLWGSNPDGDWAQDALGRIDTTLYLSTKLNQGHLLGRGRVTLIAPVLARDEEWQATTQESMFSHVRLSEGRSRTPVDEIQVSVSKRQVHAAADAQSTSRADMKSEVEILATLAARVLPPGRFDWDRLRSHAHLRAGMAQAVPGLDGLATLDRGGGEFTIPGRVLHQPRFSTGTGRAVFHVTPLPDLARGSGQFMLTTIRSEGQFNTVVYEQEDLYRGNTRRDVVMMSAEDAQSLTVREGDPVWVTTEIGKMEVVVAIVPIRSGNLAMYYPEANALVPRKIDPLSRTPAFKSVPARVSRIGRRTSELKIVVANAERQPAG